MFRTLRPIDLVGLAIITMAASTGVTAWLGLSDTPSIIALTMGLTCPAARRLIAWRRGAEAIRFGTDRGSTAVMLFAMLPWLLLPTLGLMPWQAVSGLATTHVELPLLLRWAGAVLTIVGVLRPMMATLRGTGRIRSSAYVETVGLFLATGSLFLGILAVAWLAMQAFAGERSPLSAVGDGRAVAVLA